MLPIWIAVTLTALITAVWWTRRRARPEVPPLNIDPDDPLMNEAMNKAREEIGEFCRLFGERPQDCHVKVPLITSAGELEYLWAEALKIEGDKIDVRLTTPPVTHTGKLERLQTFPLKEVVDWTVGRADGKIKGGFTMRVMFVRGREQWGDLPEKLKIEEAKYI